MFIPLGHERMSARRWPIITFALIAINLVIFVATNGAIHDQSDQLKETRVHILILAAGHPELQVPEDVQAMIDKFRQNNPETWKRMQDPNHKVQDTWDAQMRMLDPTPEDFQREMDSLASKYAQQASVSFLEQYAFVPLDPKPISYLTANFLHVGWLHLIGNMWFLWLAGFVLEDVWGRAVYSIFYLLAGAAALQFYAWTNPGSIIPTLGASGAVSALMGAFLVRFPTLKVEMGWVVPMVFRIHLRRFHLAAYWLLPMWLASEVYYASLNGTMGGVAHWAHIGGFIFGAVVALLLRVTGIEHKLDEAIDSKVVMTADAEIANATELFNNRQWDDAITILNECIARNPDSLPAYQLLAETHRRKSDLDAYYDAMIMCCQLHLKARDQKAGWDDFELFLNAQGDRAKMPPATWLELCRVAESQQLYERAIKEYQEIAAIYPAERHSLLAQLAAAKVYLNRLNRPDQALKFFEAASASPVPHLDFEPAIGAGIREAKRAMAAGAAG